MDYKVSETTAVFITAMKNFNSFYTQLCGAIAEEYGSETGDKIIDEELEEAAETFREALENLFVNNVKSTILETPEENII